MIPALIKSPPRRLATVGLVALFLASCAAPTVTPSASPSPLPTVAPTAPAYTLGPTMSPAPNGCPIAEASPSASATATSTPTPASSASAVAAPVGSPPPALTGTATVKMTTNFGDMVIKVDAKLGAHAAGAFVALARCGYYNNVIFHRIVPNSFIQAGDGTYGRLPNLSQDSKLGTGGPGWTVADDTVNTKYVRGTVALANIGSPDTGSSQFFIVLSDTAFPAGTTSYAIFGNVTSGMNVADRISLVPTGGEPDQAAGGTTSMPTQPIVITSTIVTTP
jgi:cyclophilin family peptidyl-prolyl cis-trans isomerase